MDLGSDTPHPEIYPDGLRLEMERDYNFNTRMDELRYIATCGWCDVMGEKPFRVVNTVKEVAVRSWVNHAQVHHPARLDQHFNARTVG